MKEDPMLDGRYSIEVKEWRRKGCEDFSVCIKNCRACLFKSMRDKRIIEVSKKLQELWK